MTRRGRVGFGASTTVSIVLLLCVAAAPAIATLMGAPAPYRSMHITGGVGNLVTFVGSVRVPLAGPPIDVGATDFTIEMWLRGSHRDNTEHDVSCGPNLSWLEGNQFVDRSRRLAGHSFGAALTSGVIAFGAETSRQETICGHRDVLDGAWHHVAVEYRRSDGEMMIFVDGARDAIGWIEPGDLSFPDNAYTDEMPCGTPCFDDDKIGLGGSKMSSPVGHGYTGLIDEIRVSKAVRYVGTFAPSRQPFALDAATVALYHLDDLNNNGQATDSTGSEGNALGVGDNVSQSSQQPFFASAVPAPRTSNTSRPAPHTTTPGTTRLEDGTSSSGGNRTTDGSAPGPDPAAGQGTGDEEKRPAASHALAHSSPLHGSPSIPPIAIALIGVGIAVFIAARFLRNDRL